ncbi:hypothetical protein PENSUB_1908 [Penicillium subrubescens]|uniref:Uncharacterized protein n=1 Tax=Penicillium subrubescens TaxID=1316194 RepID=A0A1Q5UIY4_9EURO|nr:hypothetical protein PENSUB_1908 [Penicillium subrubescens]
MSHEMVVSVLGGEAHAKGIDGELRARICDGDSTCLFLILIEAQRASTLAFGCPVGDGSVGNNDREMITVVLKNGWKTWRSSPFTPIAAVVEKLSNGD